ncbi:hypothetical protein ACPB8Q_02400 [Methanocaldococcus indicus]|uniref:hypothetical protein n=1 Tax=Methanocaldococcus indicus TaxID=213231 RepID=UPI003C6D7238
MCAPIAVTAGLGAPTLSAVLPQIMGMVFLTITGVWAIVSAKVSTSVKSEAVATQ